MSLGEKICALRKEKDFTQAELGNELGVTYQAVSKWERDESMPDFDMISKLAKLFGVPIAYFENGVEDYTLDDESDEDEQPEQPVQPADPTIGVCTVCGKYVTESNVAVRYPKLVCHDCHEQQQTQARRAEVARQEYEREERAEISSRYIKRSIIAAVVAGIISLAIFVTQLINMSSWQQEFDMTTGAYVGTCVFSFIMLFTWIFQLFFDGAVRSVTLSGLFFIRLPGIIFSADLDGLIFLIVMKVLFFIITIVVFVGAIIVTSFVAMLLSLFTFIPVVIKIIRRNEDILGD